jgi:hypothetical protein
MAAEVVVMAAGVSAAKPLPAKSAPHAKVDAAAKADQMHAWTDAPKDVPRHAQKAAKAKHVPHVESVPNAVSAQSAVNAVSVPPVKADVMAAQAHAVRTCLKANAPTARAKSRPS